MPILYSGSSKDLRQIIANAYTAVAIEDLNMRAMAQCLKLAKSTNDNGFGIRYKQGDRFKYLQESKTLNLSLIFLFLVFDNISKEVIYFSERPVEFLKTIYTECGPGLYTDDSILS